MKNVDSNIKMGGFHKKLKANERFRLLDGRILINNEPRTISITIINSNETTLELNNEQAKK